MTEQAGERGRGTVTMFNPSVPSVARIYDYFLGGKDNYASDREAAARIMEIEPEAPGVARQNRAFLGRVVRYLAEEAGIRQFLDIGTGIPAAGNTHQVAQASAPESRVVYVDNDPVVLAHARALLDSTPEGRCDYIESDLRDTGKIITQAARTLDFSKPVAVLFIAILHFIPDADDPQGITSRFMGAVPPGSYLAVSHATHEGLAGPAGREQLSRVYAETASGGVTLRSKTQIERFFTGLEVTSPGVVSIAAWRPKGEATGTRTLFYGGVARKDG